MHLRLASLLNTSFVTPCPLHGLVRAKSIMRNSGPSHGLIRAKSFMRNTGPSHGLIRAVLKLPNVFPR